MCEKGQDLILLTQAGGQQRSVKIDPLPPLEQLISVFHVLVRFGCRRIQNLLREKTAEMIGIHQSDLF